jgi:hypothetical protein
MRFDYIKIFNEKTLTLNWLKLNFHKFKLEDKSHLNALVMQILKLAKTPQAIDKAV